MSRPLTILLAAGGTGGHVFPALAAAEALRAKGHRAVLATDARGKRFDDAVETAQVMSGNFAGGPLAKLKGGLAILRGVVQASALLRRTDADVVVGFGGFPSLPTMIAALLLRRPTVLHEQNAVLGRVNRLFARRVDRIATAFPDVVGASAGRTTLVGNPVRAAVAGAPAYRAPAVGEEFQLLVFGGSQGARVFSDAVPAAVGQLPDDLHARLAIVQQCRPEDLDRVAAAYRASGTRAETKTFFDDMPARYAAAHAVIARAGASTVAELAAVGRPALLVPFAAAMDDHQTANARALVDAGAADVIAERDASPKAIAAWLADVISRPERLGEMASRATTVGQPNAAEALAGLIEQIGADRRAASGVRLARGIAA